MRHQLSPLLTKALARSPRHYDIILRHILTVQGNQILSDIARHVDALGMMTHFNMIQLAAKYMIPLTGLLDFLVKAGRLDRGEARAIYAALSPNLSGLLVRAAVEPGFFKPDGQTILFEEHGLPQADIQNLYGFCHEISARGQPMFRGKYGKPLALLDAPHNRLIKGRKILRYTPGRGYDVFPGWSHQFSRVFPVSVAVWEIEESTDETPPTP